MNVDYFYRNMNKYSKYLLVFACLTVLSIIGSASLNPPYQHIATAGIVVFWILGVASVLLRGYAWYKKDLLRRAEEVDTDEETEGEETEGEETEDDENKKSEVERLFS